MKVLVVGNGAREHAIAWKLRQEVPSLTLFVAPGNAGTEVIATNVPIAINNVPALLKFAKNNSIDQTVVGPELPLTLGIVNQFRAEGLKIFGPTMEATQIESSKAFAKEIMGAAGVPTPRSVSFYDLPSAQKYLKEHPAPIVVKADGLASGKGVTVALDFDTAVRALREIFVDQKFGVGPSRALIEEFVTGPEISVFCFTDGHNVSRLAAACDYKRAFDNNLGPNTGGMGGFSPPLSWGPALESEIAHRCIVPVIREMESRGIPYTGVLYGGIILTEDGPQVLEFNARFGDPEAQLLLARLNTGLLEIIEAIDNGSIGTLPIEWADLFSVAVVLAAEGYPETPRLGQLIQGLTPSKPGHPIFHSGTTRTSRGIATSGGRVVTAIGVGNHLLEARAKAYETAALITFAGAHYRRDIAFIP